MKTSTDPTRITDEASPSRSASPQELLADMRDQLITTVERMEAAAAKYEAQRKAMAAQQATDAKRVEALEKKVVQALNNSGRAVQQSRDEAVAAVQKVADEAGSSVSRVVTRDLEAANDRAEKLMAATTKVEGRQLWSALGAMVLAILPLALIMAGVWTSVATVVSGWGWVTDESLSSWMHVWRGAALVLAVAGVIFALVLSTRWVAGLIGAWKSSGMPKWPGRVRK